MPSSSGFSRVPPFTVIQARERTAAGSLQATQTLSGDAQTGPDLNLAVDPDGVAAASGVHRRRESPRSGSDRPLVRMQLLAAVVLAVLALAAPAEAFVYWGNFNDNGIGRSDLDGRNRDQSVVVGRRARSGSRSTTSTSTGPTSTRARSGARSSTARTRTRP